MMILPPIVPNLIVPYVSEECPKCHKKEDRREVCGHCGYKYPEDREGLDGVDKFLLGFFFLFVAILVFAVVQGFAVYLETTKTYDDTIRLDRWPITSPCDTHPENCKAGGGPTYYKP